MLSTVDIIIVFRLSSGVIPCLINQRCTPDHLRFSHKNYHINWNVSLTYIH